MSTTRVQVPESVDQIEIHHTDGSKTFAFPGNWLVSATVVGSDRKVLSVVTDERAQELTNQIG